MKHRLFKDGVDLKNYVTDSLNEEVVKHMENSDNIESLVEPFLVSYGLKHQSFVSNLVKIHNEFMLSKLILFIKAMAFLMFFLIFNLTDFYFSERSNTIVNFVLLPLVLLFLFIKKTEIEMFFSYHNATIMKEQILLASLMFDNFFSKQEFKDKYISLAEGKHTGSTFIIQLSMTTAQWFYNKTHYNQRTKFFVIHNYDKFTEMLTKQFNTNAFFAENFNAIKKHTIPGR